MSTRREYCQSCGRPRRALEWSCPECQSGIYTPRAKSGAVDLVKLLGPLQALPGISPGTALLLFGGRGSGKSTVALQAFESPWVLSTEMEPGLILSYAERLGVKPLGVRELHREELGIVCELPEPGQADGLILDSLNGVGHVEEVFAWVKDAALRLSLPLVVIAQVTTDDSVRGGEHVPHLAHVVAHCRKTEVGRELVIEKNRFGPEMSIPWCMAGENAPPYFYTVEGKRGRYRLSPYPWSSSKVWDAVAAGELDKPEAPAAASAQHHILYRGFVEPPDWQERKRFCEARGVHYYKVGYGE